MTRKNMFFDIDATYSGTFKEFGLGFYINLDFKKHAYGFHLKLLWVTLHIILFNKEKI